jgi:hypothetical protein
MTDRRRLLAPAAACALLLAVSSGAAGSAPRAVPGGRHVGAVGGAPAHRTTLHYAANHNFGPRGRYLLRRFGFTLADVSSPSTVRLLPPGVKALVYVGLCGGNTRHFRSVTTRFRPAWRVFGFYLMDVPDQRSCRPRHLAAESRFIHRRFAHAVTFIELENVSSSRHPRFGAYTTPHTGIDLFGVAPYPCRSELHGCDLAMIKQYVQAARRDGIARRQIVPVFQAFGGGRWRDDGGGRYLLPTARQAHAIVCRWHQLVPHPVFDYAYSWGVQRHDAALVTAPARLRRVFIAHNTGRLRC